VCSPSECQLSSSVGSAPHSFPNFQHPSHELLRENGFVWQVYNKYHARCLKGTVVIFVQHGRRSACFPGHVKCLRCGLLQSVIPASVSVSVCHMGGLCKTAGQIVLVESPRDPRNIVPASSHSKRKEVRYSLCQITLTTCITNCWVYVHSHYMKWNG